MTTTLLRDANDNIFAWRAFRVDGIYTPTAPPDALRLLCAVPTWSAKFADAFTKNGDANYFEADADISAGRVVQFDDVESMIASLKA